MRHAIRRPLFACTVLLLAACSSSTGNSTDPTGSSGEGIAWTVIDSDPGAPVQVEANHGYAVTSSAQVRFVLPPSPAFEPGDLVAVTGRAAAGFVVDLAPDWMAHGPGVVSLPESFGGQADPPALPATIRTSALSYDGAWTFAGGHATDASSAATVWSYRGGVWEAEVGGGTYAVPAAIAVSDDGDFACFVESTGEHWTGSVTDARVWCRVPHESDSTVRFLPNTVPGSGTGFAWADVAMSPSGKTIFVVGGDHENTQVWRGSWNGGSGEDAFTFTRLDPLPGRYVAVAASGNAQTVVLVSASSGPAEGMLLVSRSQGASFDFEAHLAEYTDVAISRDGSTIVASTSDPRHGVLLSRDGGWAWKTAIAGAPGASFTHVACTADCGLMTLSRSGPSPGLLVSANLGEDWLSPGYSFPTLPVWLALSGDGLASADVWGPDASSPGTLQSGRASPGYSQRIIGAPGASVTLLRLASGFWTVQQATGVLLGNVTDR